ncbi:ABC transporter substrate-binding protein [Ilumatobacter sp.]|uniref:ABC transporter substrate-binding protein n=1 Tax=Ilumatobacter sp. TaxID=1967498 RepID=UPI003B52F1B3
MACRDVRAVAGRRRARGAAGAVAIAAGTLAACTGDGSGDPTPTAATTTTAPPAPTVDDGVLRIGVLVPDDSTGVSTAVTTAAQRTVDDVNAAGGVLGRDVDLVFENEGTTPAATTTAIETLVAEGAPGGVDAIIGPLSSTNAIGALDAAVSAKVVTCSPAASAMALDDYPDDGLFFRTIPTDSLQAVAIAQQARETGATQMAIVHVDDAYGRPYAEAVRDALASDGSTVVDVIAVAAGDDELGDDLAGVGEAQVVIVLGGGTDTARFLEAIAARGPSPAAVIVNDAARSPGNAPIVSSLPADFRNRIVGVAPQITVRPAGLDDLPVPFAPQIDDCVNLIALSAVQGGSDAPTAIAAQMSPVSESGSVCRDFATCRAQLADRLQINYQGLTGITDLARDGDPGRGRFDLYRFDADGADVYDERTITVGP